VDVRESFEVVAEADTCYCGGNNRGMKGDTSPGNYRECSAINAVRCRLGYT